jgi:hypothetical protein
VSRPASGLIQPPMDTDAFSLGGNGTGAWIWPLTYA